jgi:hypothetical protein
MINGAKLRVQDQGRKIKSAKKKPQTLQTQFLGLNPSFQRMEETIKTFNKIDSKFIVGLV